MGLRPCILWSEKTTRSAPHSLLRDGTSAAASQGFAVFPRKLQLQLWFHRQQTPTGITESAEHPGEALLLLPKSGGLLPDPGQGFECLDGAPCRVRKLSHDVLCHPRQSSGWSGVSWRSGGGENDVRLNFSHPHVVMLGKILSQAGIPPVDVVIGTCLASCIATLMSVSFHPPSVSSPGEPSTTIVS